MSVQRFRTFSQRRGIAEPFKMHEGVPAHLRGHLLEWVTGHLWGRLAPVDYEALSQMLIIDLEIEFSSTGHAERVKAIRRHIRESTDQFLDVVDYLVNGLSAPDLELMLARGGSVYSVVEDDAALFEHRLGERVLPEAKQIYESAIAAGDEVADDLSEAWRRAFGRDPDASDAWDHARRAVEGALHQIVLPKAARGQWNPLMKAIEAKPEKWQFVLSEGDGAGDGSAILPTLSLIGYDPGRHPGGEEGPSLEQAKAVVVLAATVVEWVRQGAFTAVAE